MVTIVNLIGEVGKRKANIAATRLLDLGVSFNYEIVGDCYTISVAETDVRLSVGAINNKFYWEGMK